MTIVRRPSPLGELLSLRQAMDRFFEDSFVHSRPWSLNGDIGAPVPLDITSSTDAFIVDAALPGIAPEDVQITVDDGTLTIRAETQSERKEEDGQTLISEIRRGSVRRSVALPTGLEADKASATFEHGVLHLRIPKAEAMKPRQIRISPARDGRSTRTSSETASDTTPAGDTGGQDG